MSRASRQVVSWRFAANECRRTAEEGSVESKIMSADDDGQLHGSPTGISLVDLKIDALNMTICGNATFRAWQKKERAFGCKKATYKSLTGALEGHPGDQPGGDVRPRIAHGQNATDGEFPFYAWLSTGCGGALIHDNLVLTTAHCVQSKQNITVSLGSNRADRKDAVIKSADKWCWLNAFKTQKFDAQAGPFFDIAVLRLAGALKYKPGRISPACLWPEDGELHSNGSICAQAGLGYTGPRWREPSALQTYQMRRDATCPVEHVSYSCYQSTGVGISCDGDGGSPVLCYGACLGNRNVTKAFIAGVHSAGYPDDCSSRSKMNWAADLGKLSKELAQLVHATQQKLDGPSKGVGITCARPGPIQLV